MMGYQQHKAPVLPEAMIPLPGSLLPDILEIPCGLLHRAMGSLERFYQAQRVLARSGWTYDIAWDSWRHPSAPAPEKMSLREYRKTPLYRRVVRSMFLNGWPK